MHVFEEQVTAGKYESMGKTFTGYVESSPEMFCDVLSCLCYLYCK